MRSFEGILAKSEDILHIAGCLALVGIAVLINADIFLRVLVGFPLQFQFELTELYLMPALATLSLSRVFRDGGHLALDVVPQAALGETLRRLVLALSASFAIALALMSGRFAARAFLRGEIEYGAYDWHLGWAYASVPLGCGLLAIRLIYETVKKGETNATP